jgi:purine-binding chemotaxis protein CheW
MPPTDDEILALRARRLAAPAVQSARHATLPAIVFRRGDERYGLPTTSALAVIRQPVWRPLPRTPAALAGLLLVRGEILPLFDVAVLLGSVAWPPDRIEAAVLIAAVVPFAVVADEVTGASALPEALEPPPARLDARSAAWVRGMSADAVVVLDAAALAADERLWIGRDDLEVTAP